MKIRVNSHTVEIVKEQTEPINEREIKVSKCEFEFDEAITSDFVKEAYFTLDGNTYKKIIQNNECDYPSEVLTQKGTLEIGVVAFKVENGEEIVRYNPSPDYFESWVGSLKDAENSEPITPSEMEQFEQELQEGLNDIDDKIDEVDDKIEEVNTAITETNNLDLDVSDKVDGDVTVTLTKKDASTKSVVISDGTSLQFMWQGTSLGIKTDDMSEYVFVDLQGQTGQTGATGNGIASITKTSSTGLVDTYTITFTDGNTTTFNVENGNGIDHISLTSQSGATKVYTIYYTDGTTSEYTVQDGEVTQEVFDEEVDRLKMIYNAMPKVSGEGTDLTLDNTAECPVYDIELSPSELEQETTSGKNLGYLEIESIDANGAFVEVGNKVYRTLIADNLPAGTYTFSVNLSDCWLIRESVNGTIKTLSSNRSTRTITTTTDGTYMIAFKKQDSSEITEELEAQLEVGDTATSYEPFTYGASPNPQYPQEIHTVSGENEVVVENKNLANSNDIIDGSFTTVEQIINNTGYANVGDGVYRILRIENLPAGSYSLQIIWNDTARFIRKFQDNNLGSVGVNNNIYTFTTESTGLFAIQFRNSSSTAFTENDYKIILVKGTYTSSTMPDYVPHQEQTYPLSLGDLEYCKIGDYEDLFFKNVVGSTYYDSTLELNKWYLKKNIGKYILDGTENWVSSPLGTNSWTLNNAINTIYDTSKKQILSNIFRGIAQDDRNTAGNNVIYTTTNTQFMIRNTNLTTKAEVQTTTNGNYIYFYLATPTNILLNDTLQTQLDNIQKAITYQDQTNVSQTNNDLPFVIKLSAIRDLSGIFEEI